MVLQKKVVKFTDITEYSVFGWEVEGNAPDGSVILKRDGDDPKAKKYLNLELKYDSIKSKIKKLQKPEYPENDGKICSTGLCVLLTLFLIPVGLFLLFYKHGKAKYAQEMKAYEKQIQEYEDELE